jgi:small subunit ribosomal protein S25e
VKDKAQHAVILDKATSDKLYKDVQSYRLVTVATLVDRLKINGSLARRCIKDLEEKGMIKPVVEHSRMKIYSRFRTNGGAGNREGADMDDSSRCWYCGIKHRRTTLGG